MLCRFLAVLLLSALLPACGGDADRGESIPVWSSLEQALDAFEANDAARLTEALVPPLMRQSWERRWDQQRRQPVTDAFRERFAERLRSLTRESAEQRLVIWLAERASELDEQKATMLPSLRALLLSAASVDAGQATNQPGLAFLDGLLSWVQRTELADRKRLLQLSDLIVEQLRASDIRRWSDVEAMSFSDLLEEGDRLLRVVRGAMEIYQLRPADERQDVTFETLENDGERALVRAQLSLFGQPHRIDLPMVRRETGWYLEAIARQAPPEPPQLRAAPPRD